MKSTDTGLDTDATERIMAERRNEAVPVTGALADVANERRRQIDAEGWTAEHDDEHDPGELAAAGCSYALNAAKTLWGIKGLRSQPPMWPWDAEWWKPKDPRRDLVRAAALIVAEIDRLDRDAARKVGR